MQLILDRQALHRIPETDRNLPKTMEYLRNALKDLSCRVFSPMEGALCAWFDMGAQQTIAFRADADALPVTEQTGLEFASRHPGYMHACGHDGHMAILLELARRLSGAQLDKNVLLVFQPAEETSGGARDLCETGVFSDYRVEAIFGLHLWPGLGKGVVATKPGPMMSRSCEVNVTFTGRTAHIAKSAEGADAMAAAVAFYRSITDFEAALPADCLRLLKFGKMDCGTVRNAVAAKARLEGSLRTFDDGVFDALWNALEHCADEAAAAFGCQVQVQRSAGYPPLCNPEDLYRRISEIVQVQQLEAPSMTTEDFSWYQQYIPGLFFFLGVGETPPLHASTFAFDEAVLAEGVRLFESIAQNF